MVDKSFVHKILVIKLRAIGDVLLSTVVLKNLRTAFPSAEIDFLTEQPSRDVIEGNPFVNSLITYHPKRRGGLRLIRQIRRRNYDLVIDLFGNPRSALVTYFSGAKYRVGYRFKWRQYCYNVVVEPRGGEVHNIEFNLDALRAIGVTVSDFSICFPCPAEAHDLAERSFTDAKLNGRFIVALNPGGGWYTKRWRLPQYAELGDLISEKFHAQVLIIWGPGERADAEEIQSRMKSEAVLTPPCTLKELAAILSRCSALVTNDSGPMHIAAAMGTPVLAIFGPTNPELQGPLGDQH